jgi:hypothetical protein
MVGVVMVKIRYRERRRSENVSECEDILYIDDSGED